MKRHAPATARNSAAIAEVLARELPSSGTVLEIASGTGEHAVYMARRFPALTWQPSDRDTDALRSIDEWRSDVQTRNILKPIELDAAESDWPIEKTDAIFCSNMVHISPWNATLGLLKGSGRRLLAGMPLILYGPFIASDSDTAASNVAFYQSLRQQNPEWGLRSIPDLDRLAITNRLVRTSKYAMPANNLSLVYRKSA